MLTLPASAGELSIEKVTTNGPDGIKTAEFVTSNSPEADTQAQVLERLLENTGSMKSAVRAEIRKAAADALAYLDRKGIDPRHVRVRLRVRCGRKYIVAQRKAPQQPALMESATTDIEQAKPVVVKSLVETCSVKLMMSRKKQPQPAQMQNFAIELPALSEESD